MTKDYLSLVFLNQNVEPLSIFDYLSIVCLTILQRSLSYIMSRLPRVKQNFSTISRKKLKNKIIPVKKKYNGNEAIPVYEHE